MMDDGGRALETQGTRQMIEKEAEETNVCQQGVECINDNIYFVWAFSISRRSSEILGSSGRTICFKFWVTEVALWILSVHDKATEESDWQLIKTKASDWLMGIQDETESCPSASHSWDIMSGYEHPGAWCPNLIRPSDYLSCNFPEDLGGFLLNYHQFLVVWPFIRVRGHFICPLTK